MASLPRLTYFDGPGRAQLIRTLLGLAGQDYSEQLVRDRDTMLRLVDSGDLLYSQVPLLEIDGLKIVQSGAIARYVARKYDLFGADPAEMCLVDMLTEGAQDLYMQVIGLPFIKEASSTPANYDTQIADVKEKHGPRYLSVFEAQLAKKGTPFLVGDKPTMADAAVFSAVDFALTPIPDLLDGFPLVKALVERIRALPTMAAYLQSPNYKGYPGPKYVDEVQRSLGRK